MYSKLTIKTPERRHWRTSGVFIVNFEHITMNTPLLRLSVILEICETSSPSSLINLHSTWAVLSDEIIHGIIFLSCSARIFDESLAFTSDEETGL